MADRSKDRSGTSDRCMAAMKEDLAAWMSSILSLVITVETLLEDLETGVVLCRLANTIQRTGEEFLGKNPSIPRNMFPPCGVTYKERTAFRGSFIARDNVANFIRWCRELGVSDVIMFETEDLVLLKNEKSVILTLMDVARISVKFGLEPSDLVRMENEIDQEIEQQPADEIMEEPMIRLKKEHKSHSLDDLVYQVLDQCTCPVRFPVLRVAEGKYRMGESKNLIFVRVMRKHVMVRVGGGWDTLERYFDKHDPCKMSDKQRRNSVKSPRSRSGSDAIGRSPSSLSISSTDSHDSGGLPVSHGRTASWSSSQNHAFQLESPREPVKKMTSTSPTPSSGSPRLQHKQRRGTTARDTPPRTIDTQHQGRLSRRSKSMQELSTVAVTDSRSPPRSKPTVSSSRRKQSVTEESTTTSLGAKGQTQGKSLVASSRKSSLGVPQREYPPGRSRLSSSGPVGSNRPSPSQVSRSASFGSRPRPVVPVMEPRSRTVVTSRQTRETQRRASSAAPMRSESKDDLQRKEPVARRRSCSATPQENARLPGSPKQTKRSTAENKNEATSRRPSMSKIPTPRQKQEQPATNRKPSTGSKEAARVHRTLPSTPGERKSPITPQVNGANNTQTTKPSRGTTVDNKRTERKTPPFSRQEDKPGNLKEPLGNSQSFQYADNKRTERKRLPSSCQEDKSANQRMQMEILPTKNCETVERNIEINEQDELRKNEEQRKEVKVDNFNGIDVSYSDTSYGETTDLSICLDQTDNNSRASGILSPDEPYSKKLTLNGGRKLSGCSLETESDATGDLLSDFTDTDFDFKSQRYSGLSETSSDYSCGASPASMLFNSGEVALDSMESIAEPDPPVLRTSTTQKDSLVNLNLQASATPNTKSRIFDDDSQTHRNEENPGSTSDPVTQPSDKAMFFDVEQYNEKYPDDDYVNAGSSPRLSLVQSLISSIEKRNSNSGNGQRTKKSPRSTPVTAGKDSLEKTGHLHKTPSNNEMLPPFNELNKDFQQNHVENGDAGTEKRVPSSRKELPITYDFNRNISDSEITEAQRIPAEKPFESFQSVDRRFKASKSPQDKAKIKDKELDAFPRPQRQFTLEEMIEDMMPADTEPKESDENRITSPNPRCQAFL